MHRLSARFRSFFGNRWLVAVAAMWMQSCAGVGYVYGSISPVLKASLGYNQKQVAALAIAKDLGDSVGFLAGTLCAVLPLWAALLVGAAENLIGYGWVWLAVAGIVPAPPLWAMCILIFIGNNGETYYNTAALVSCVQNFPKSRGPVVGIMKGFAGLSGAILTQIYAVLHTRDETTIVLLVAVGPTLVVLALMFIVRPVGGHKQARPSDHLSISFIYVVCLLLAAYLLCVMLLEDLVALSTTIVTWFTVGLGIILALPIIIPLALTFTSDDGSAATPLLLPDAPSNASSTSGQAEEQPEVILSEVEDEKPKEVDLLPAEERRKRIAQLQARLLNAAAVGAVRVKRRKGPHRGEDFTLMQALIKADFWLLFFSLLLGSGSGLAVIDNLGQMSESQGYDNTHIFVSMISTWNFLGRIAGGYLSEIVVKEYVYPRPLALAMAQLLMSVGHFLLATAWPGMLYVAMLLVGLGYGAHWAIVPAAASELFGLKNFGMLYNFLTIANPAGSLIFSGLIASRIYDAEAAKQAHGNLLRGLSDAEASLQCSGAVCFFVSSMIMSAFCIVAAALSGVLVHRTRVVYAHLYGKART